VDASATKNEETFVENSLRNLADNNEITNGDHVIITNGYWDHGYGGAETRLTHDDRDLHDAAVYSGAYINDNESQQFVWHELAHMMGNEHIDGCYDIR